MQLNNVYKEYSQKSQIFLYPQLKLPTGTPPLRTYIQWQGRFESTERKFICVYQNRTDDNFIVYQETVLKKHPMFFLFEENEHHKVFVFDFASKNEGVNPSLNEDWEKFLTGKYSKLSFDSKRNISRYFGNKTARSVYIDSYINPHKYFDIYATLLGEKKEDFMVNGELCDVPDFQKEQYCEYDPNWKLA